MNDDEEGELKERKKTKENVGDEKEVVDGEVKTGGTGGPQYACHICLDDAADPVVTLCGHLFCWPCLYRWLEQPHGNVCPVCKAGITKESVIPIYGRGGSKEDPREKPPARPQGQRVEPPPQRNRFWQDTSINFGPYGVQVAFGGGLGHVGFGTPFLFGGPMGNVFDHHRTEYINQPSNETEAERIRREREREGQLVSQGLMFLGLCVLIIILLL